MTKIYSLLLATAIMILVMVYAYDPRYVLLYVGSLAVVIVMGYSLSQGKNHQHLQHKTH